MIPLKNVLIVNGASSGVTAVGLIAFPNLMSDVFQVTHPSVFTGVGIFLLAFAALVLFESARSPLNPKGVRLIIVLDISWVICSLVSVALLLNVVSIIGHALIIGVAAWVGLMAYLQTKGLKQITV